MTTKYINPFALTHERFVVVTYTQAPNGKWNELTEFKSKITPTVLQQASVILDVDARRCIKNSLDPDATFAEVLNFYKQKLGEKITARLPADLQ